MRCRRILPLSGLVFSLFVSPCLADQVVYFLNGKAITVKSVEKGEKYTVLEIEGGGRMGVPTDQISRIEELVVAPPPVAQIAPAQAPAAPAPGAAAVPDPSQQTAAAVPGAPANPPQPAQFAPGPGIGGRATGGPGQNLAGLNPLSIGGEQAPAPAVRPAQDARRGANIGRPMQGMGAGRQNMPGAGRFGGRATPGGGRAGRMYDMIRPQAGQGGTPPNPAAPAVEDPPPVVEAPQPAVEAPPPTPEPEEPTAPSDDSNAEPSDPSPPEAEDSSGSSSGGAS